MRKKFIITISISVFILLALFGYKQLDPKYKPARNIFDEMYVKMGRVTPSKKVTRKDYSSFDDNDKEYSAVQFTYQESTHSKYKKIFIKKDNADKKLNISFRQSLNENLSLIMWFIYGPNSKIAKEELVIYDDKNNDYPF